MDWISIEDKKPEQGQAVLCYQTWPKDTAFNCLAFPLCRCWYYVAEYDGNGFRERGIEIRYFQHISHWMPLPEKPE